jgi:fermentation-respiration switch protein FrsA (DUF1100 family)
MIRRLIRAAFFAALTFAVGGSVATVLLEDRMIYFPTRHPDGDWAAKERTSLPVEDVWLDTGDGVRIHGWLARGGGDAPAPPTVLWFHGNAGNLSDRAGWLFALARGLHADVLIVDYRGYGRSGGRPSEQGLYQDAEAAYRWLTAERGVAAERLWIYGVSLGGAPALELASKHHCAGLVIQSTFTGALAMARRMLPLVPGFFIRSRFPNAERLAGITAPKLIIHGRRDEVIPFSMGEELYALAPEPKTSLWLPDVGHNDIVARRGADILVAMRAMITRDPAPGSPPRSP